jgi:acrylyl-CoA reductase (NADPH)
MRPLPERLIAWERFARDLDIAKLDVITTEIDLDHALDAAARVVGGRIRGRVVVKVA